jgi:HEAT repeat protein
VRHRLFRIVKVLCAEGVNMQAKRVIRWGLSGVCLVTGAIWVGCSTPASNGGLKSEHALVRKAAVEALGKHADMSSYNDLVGVLKTDPDRLVRSQAAFAIGKISQKHFSIGFEPLAQAVEGDKSVLGRSAAALALSSTRDSRAVSVLVSALSDTSRGEVKVRTGDRVVTYRACTADAARTSLEKIVGLKYTSAAATAQAQRDEIAAQWSNWYASAAASLPDGRAVATRE